MIILYTTERDYPWGTLRSTHGSKTKVVLEEKRQEHALEIGEQLIEGLRELMENHELIGDVRGSGLFLGVELVRNRKTREPATEETDAVVNQMRAAGILLGTDGPFHNVIKIRPPMPFNSDNALQLIDTLRRVLTNLPIKLNPNRTSSQV